MNSIEIPIGVLKENKITVEEYLILQSLGDEIPDLSYLLIDPDKAIKKLQERGFIKITDTGIDIREAGKVFLKPKPELFLEFWNSYPFKVPGNNGTTRVLRTLSPDSEQAKKIRKKYEAIIKGKTPLHNKIVKCLEIQKEQMRHNLKYFQEVEVWLNKRTWEKYEHLLASQKDSSTEEESAYGQKLV